MTDLVSQLVGALEEAEEWVQEYVTQMRSYVISDSAAKSLANIRAALSAAKDGGWVAAQNKPVAYRVDWPVEAGVGMRRFYGADEWESARGTVYFFGGIPTPLAPLPAPPAQKDNT